MFRLQFGRLLWLAAGWPPPSTAAASSGFVRQGDGERLESLFREEAEHRLENLFHLVVANLDRAARALDGPARLALDAASAQITTLSRLNLEHPGLPSVDTCGVRVEALGALLNGLVLRPRGHLLLVNVAPGLESIRLTPPTARCLDLVIMEAVINATKHAFPERSGGRVTVRLFQSAQQISCSIVDDGTGGLAGPGHEDSRGMRLIDALTQQAGGNCRWIFGQSGTGVHVQLPIAEAECSLPGNPRSIQQHAC